MSIALMVDYRSLSQHQLQLLANRGDAHAGRFIGRVAAPGRVSRDTTTAATRLVDAEAEKRREVFHDVARNLGLPPYSAFSRPPESQGDVNLRISDGGPNARGAKDPAKYRRDPMAGPEPLSAKEKAARAKIFKNLGLQVMDDADGAESEDTVYAALGLGKGGKCK